MYVQSDLHILFQNNLQTAQHTAKQMKNGINPSSRDYMGQETMRHNDYYLHPRNSMLDVQPMHLVHVPRLVNMNRPLKWQVGTKNALDIVTSRSKSEVTVYPNSVGLSIWDLLQKNS